MEKGKLAKWLKKEGDTVKAGDVHRRDRDRQGDDGSRGGRRGHARQDPRRRGHRGRGGQHADRRDPRRRREHDGRERCADAKPAARSRRPSRSPQPARRRGQADAPAAAEAAPRRAARRPTPQPIPTCRQAPRWSSMTVREALRDAMAEEMRRDDRRLRDGRGGRRVPGRLQGHAGPAAGVRRRARHRHADHRARLCRPRRRRGACRA